MLESMKLNQEAVQQALHNLSDWQGDTRGIRAIFNFDSYEAGVAFAMHIALLAQIENHHPDTLSIGWKKVEVCYVTHSIGGVSLLDIQAARTISQLYKR